VVTWVLAWLAGVIGLLPALADPVKALRASLAAMFAFTAVSHFVHQTRADLLKMVPPAFPRPDLLVTLTGLLELAGAIGLLWGPWHRKAAIAMAILLVAMFPANAYAARAGLVIGERRVLSLGPRAAIQLYWILCLVEVAYRGR
jgi:uncharacterized membrane protein